jgi:hypothetical protein
MNSIVWLETQFRRLFRKQYVLYRFQTRYALGQAFLSLFISLTVAFVVYRLFAGGSPIETLETNDFVRGRAAWLILGMIGLLGSSSGLFYLLVVLTTHRVAGPLLVLSQCLEKLKRGQYPSRRRLRETDELKELLTLFYETVDRLRARDREEAAVIGKAVDILSPLASDRVANEAIASLRAVIVAKHFAVEESGQRTASSGEPMLGLASKVVV